MALVYLKLSIQSKYLNQANGIIIKLAQPGDDGKGNMKIKKRYKIVSFMLTVVCGLSRCKTDLQPENIYTS